MYGIVIVEPREGLPEVGKEFAIVQSEWYLGAQGKEADLEKAMAAAPAPDLVLFNGVANQHKDHPLQVATGEQVRVFDLAPAQGAVIEFSTAEDGLYPKVTHAFNFVGRGALGLFQAGDGDPTN